MKIYRCTKRFLCGPIKQYLPVGALIARYENAVRLVIQDAPRSDTDIFNQIVDGIEYTNASQVSWFYAFENPVSKNKIGYFELVSSSPEDSFGNVGGGGGTGGTGSTGPTGSTGATGLLVLAVEQLGRQEQQGLLGRLIWHHLLLLRRV